MRGKILLVSFILGVLAVSCLNSDIEPAESQYTQLCTQSDFGDGYLFTSDGGQKFYTTQLPEDYEFVAGERAMILFTILQEMPAGSIYDFLIKVSGINNVPVKEIIRINEENRDTLGQAGVTFNQLWVSGRYFNVDFSFLAKDKKHYFNLTFDPDDQPEEANIVKLVFRHKDNEDEAYSMYRAMTSFDLYSLEQPLMPPFTIIFEGKDAYGREVNEEIEVKAETDN